MSKPKAITDKGIILYFDYAYIINFLNNEEKGVLLSLLLDYNNLPLINPTENNNINNVYNYISNRILDYKKDRSIAQQAGKRGGNPLLTLKGTDNPTLKLKEKKRNIKENKIIIKEKEKESNDFEIIFDLWNEFAESNNLNKIISLSDKRKSAIVNRSKEKEFDFQLILDKISNSEFLLGSTGWKVDFDFIFLSKNNYLKIIEGKYDNKINQGASRNEPKYGIV